MSRTNSYFNTNVELSVCKKFICTCQVVSKWIFDVLWTARGHLCTIKHCLKLIHILQLQKNYAHITYPQSTVSKHRDIPRGIPQVARRVSLTNRAIGKPITQEPEPADPTATIPWPVVGRRKGGKIISNTNIIGPPSVSFCTFKQLSNFWKYIVKWKKHMTQTLAIPTGSSRERPVCWRKAHVL